MNDRWLTLVHARLRSEGMRLGAGRERVLEELARGECLRTAQDLSRQLEAGADRVAVATVYRTLDALQALGLLLRVDAGTGVGHYELCLPDETAHHHSVCERCGRILPFQDRELEQAIDRAVAQVHFAPQRRDLVVHGLCALCCDQAAAR